MTRIPKEVPTTVRWGFTLVMGVAVAVFTALTGSSLETVAGAGVIAAAMGWFFFK